MTSARELFEQALGSDEPPLQVDFAAINAAGVRQHRRTRLLTVTGAVAAVIVLTGGILLASINRPPDGTVTPVGPVCTGVATGAPPALSTAPETSFLLGFSWKMTGPPELLDWANPDSAVPPTINRSPTPLTGDDDLPPEMLNAGDPRRCPARSRIDLAIARIVARSVCFVARQSGGPGNGPRWPQDRRNQLRKKSAPIHVAAREHVGAGPSARRGWPPGQRACQEWSC